jgi:hypothetical protein
VGRGFEPDRRARGPLEFRGIKVLVSDRIPPREAASLTRSLRSTISRRSPYLGATAWVLFHRLDRDDTERYLTGRIVRRNVSP